MSSETLTAINSKVSGVVEGRGRNPSWGRNRRAAPPILGLAFGGGTLDWIGGRNWGLVEGFDERERDVEREREWRRRRGQTHRRSVVVRKPPHCIFN